MTARDVRLKCRIYGDTLGYVENKQLHVATIERAMDTYARQEAKTEAIGFTLWSDKNATQVNADRWKTGIDNWFKVHTTEQLYDLYQQQKQK